MKLLELRNIHFQYTDGKPVLKDITATLEAGRVYAILGPSGCGKATFLSLLGGLDIPTKGSIAYNGKIITPNDLVKHRRNNVSFVFQDFNLIEYLNPIENVNLASPLPALPILKKVGITAEDAQRNVKKLSGGQQQRVAVARALASDARLLLADEPTGNLDEDTAAGIAQLLIESAHKLGKCVVIVTHSQDLARQADVILYLKRGRIKIMDSHN